jgi:hypothetical protein
VITTKKYPRNNPKAKAWRRLEEFFRNQKAEAERLCERKKHEI